VETRPTLPSSSERPRPKAALSFRIPSRCGRVRVLLRHMTFDQNQRTRKHQGQPGSSSITNGLSFGSSLLSLWRALAGTEQVYWTCRSFEKMRKRTKTDLGLNASCEVSKLFTMSLDYYCVPGTNLLDQNMAANPGIMTIIKPLHDCDEGAGLYINGCYPIIHSIMIK